MKNNWMLKLPHPVRLIVAKSIVSFAKSGNLNKVAHLLEQKKWDVSTVYPLLRKSYSAEELRSILKNPIKDTQVQATLAEISDRTPWMESFSKSTIGEMETYTRDVLLRDTDQMAMAHALEVRVPFFDYRLVEYVLSLKDELKYPHTPKQLLVDALAPRLPNEIVHRRKMGFTFPIGHWLRNELAEMAEAKIKYLADRNEFNHDGVWKKWTAFKKGDNSILWPRIWKLVVLSDWLQRNKL